MTQYTYALIDGVMRQTAIHELYSRKEALQTIPLYINTPHKDNYDLGPILVAALNGSSLINELQQIEWIKSTTIIYSSEYLSKVAEHLQKLITVTDETAITTLFRFADPLVTYYWLKSYQANALVDIMGPIDKWQIAKPIAAWQQPTIEWEIFTNPKQEPVNFQINYLNEPQVNALEEASAFKLKNEIYQTCTQIAPQFFKNQPEQTITDWMDKRFREAKSFGALSKRTYAMWFVMAMEFGNDFATNNQGHYQQWLTENTQNKGLPPEANLQTFFDNRPQIETPVVMEI